MQTITQSPESHRQAPRIPGGCFAVAIAPFVNATLNPARDPSSRYGAYLPRTSAIDIIAAGIAYHDPDVRGVGPDGIEICAFGGFGRLIPWTEVREVTIRAVDAHGDTIAREVVYSFAESQAA